MTADRTKKADSNGHPKGHPNGHANGYSKGHTKGHAKGKVLVAMSGGVDSSVTAALLLERGYEVVGCFMRNGAYDAFEPDEDDSDDNADTGWLGSKRSEAPRENRADAAPATPSRRGESASPAGPPACSTGTCGSPSPKKNRQGCCSVNDAADARLVAAMLGVPFYVMNFKKDFGRIMDYFAAEYHAGRTPNPCVRCNDWLKFGKLMDYAASIDADFVATGHYARIDRTAGRPRLMRGVDVDKDQSYVLFGSRRDRLDRMLLPIGDFHKADVRRMAEERGLPVFDKPDSYEICFVPDNDYRRFLRDRQPDAMQPGAFVDSSGNTLGEHDGHQNFTVGQRRGLGVTAEVPLYVIDKNAAANTVTLGPREKLGVTGLRAEQTNWLIDDLPTPDAPMRVLIQTRSNGQPTPGEVWATFGANDSRDGCPTALEARFDAPHDAVSPGQAVVCYRDNELIGGGWINEALR